jgi:hypothetical protein
MKKMFLILFVLKSARDEKVISSTNDWNSNMGKACTGKNMSAGESNFTWNQDYNPIAGYNWDESYNSEHNKAILDDTMGISWYDWVLEPNIIINGFLINTLWLNRNQ